MRGYMIACADARTILDAIFGQVTEQLPERCPHGYHVTEGECPTCDVDRTGHLPSGRHVGTATSDVDHVGFYL